MSRLSWCSGFTRPSNRPPMKPLRLKTSQATSCPCRKSRWRLKFKQLFLIGEKNLSQNSLLPGKRRAWHGSVKGGALSLGSWSDTVIGVGVTEQRGRHMGLVALATFPPTIFPLGSCPIAPSQQETQSHPSPLFLLQQ